MRPGGFLTSRRAGEPIAGRAPRSDPAAVVRALRAGYGRVIGIDGVDLEVGSGEILGIAGESGAGKSTLLRCLAGELSPMAGRVNLGTDTSPALVWQHTALCDNLDIAENLLLGAEPRWRLLRSAVSRHELARRLLADLGLAARLGPTTATAGSLAVVQRQLLVVARALIAARRLLLLDEPTDPLGTTDTGRVERLVRRVQVEGCAVVVVSHDLEQLFGLADRIVVLRHGRVVGEVDPVSGHPDDVLALASGHPPESSAHHQLTRLHALRGRLATADPTSAPLVVLSALGAALGADRLALHLADGSGRLRLSCSLGLPEGLCRAWRLVGTGSEGGAIGRAARTGEPELVSDVRTAEAWSGMRRRLWEQRVASSWSVPFGGSDASSGVITVLRTRIGDPTRAELDLAQLYGGYLSAALERERLVGQLTSRNLVLETIRDMLETLGGPAPVGESLRTALEVLRRGLGAESVAVYSAAASGGQLALAGAAGQPDEGVDGTALARVVEQHRAGAADHGTAATLPAGHDRWLHLVTFADPTEVAALLVARHGEPADPDERALVEDAAHSVQLAMARHRAQQATQEAAALRRTQQLQHDFLARLSHELRTPLTAITGYADTMLQPDVDWDSDSRERFLTRIAVESRRMARLVGDLLDLSTIETGILRLQHDWCELRLVLEAARDCLAVAVRPRVEVDVPVDLPPIWADHDRLEQVFVNLLDNAFRHNPPGTRVWLRAAAGDRTVTVRVRDDGDGRLERLGQPDTPATPRPATAGAGLGLSISRAIVAAHGGSMQAEQADPGLCFAVDLPVEPEAAAEEPPVMAAGAVDD